MSETVIPSSVDVVDVPTAWLVFDEDNPNEMDDRTFNALCESIEDEGWMEPIQVVENGEEYMIVGGHHRAKAAEVLGMTHVPAVLLDPEKFDEDRRKWNLVKLNILRGDLNPQKFATLYEDLAKRYDKDALKTLMGFTSEDAFRRMYKDVKKALPPEMQEALDDVADEIKTIDDLSLVLNRLFRDYGETLPSNMMVFSWGGKEVLWVRCDDELWDMVQWMAEDVKEHKGDMNQVMKLHLQNGIQTI